MAYCYATVDNVAARSPRAMNADERELCAALLADAAVIIDAANDDAPDAAKALVSCRMVMRALGDGQSVGIPIGASQGTMTALGYSQSWTMSGGSTGELYLSKQDKRLLRLGNSIGSASPIEALAHSGEGKTW